MRTPEDALSIYFGVGLKIQGIEYTVNTHLS